MEVERKKMLREKERERERQRDREERERQRGERDRGREKQAQREKIPINKRVGGGGGGGDQNLHIEHIEEKKVLDIFPLRMTQIKDAKLRLLLKTSPRKNEHFCFVKYPIPIPMQLWMTGKLMHIDWFTTSCKKNI